MLTLILIILLKNIYIAVEKEKIYMLVVITVLCLQSAMEHHLIQYWYNPFLLITFSYVLDLKRDKKKKERDEIWIENLN